MWAALTSSDALAAWLMPNDFEPVAGHRFTLRAKPAPGFDGIVQCEVLELDPPNRMVWSWAGGQIDTTVTFTLEATPGAGTRLRLRQAGFHGLAGQLTRRILAGGYPGILGGRLPAYLDQRRPPRGNRRAGRKPGHGRVRRGLARLPQCLPPLAAAPDGIGRNVMAVTNLEVISVPVSDQDRAKDFYVNQLGFAEQMDASVGDSMRWVMLRPPGSGTSITLVTWFGTMPAGRSRARCSAVTTSSRPWAS